MRYAKAITFAAVVHVMSLSDAMVACTQRPIQEAQSIEKARIVVDEYVKALTGEEAHRLQRISSSGGICVIRNHVSGGVGSRGKDVRDQYRKVPEDLIFPVKGEVAIRPKEMFERLLNAGQIPLVYADMEILDGGRIPATQELLESVEKVAELRKQAGPYGLVSMNEVILLDLDSNDDIYGSAAIFHAEQGQFRLMVLIDIR